MTSYKAILGCRVCGNRQLEKVLDLGEQMLTGVFPKAPDPAITSGPLQLVKCHGAGTCGLVQMAHSYALDEMYGDNYGYRSGLNASMVAHLERKVERIRSLVDLRPEDVVIDIGSNDATTLKAFPSNLSLIGVDPTGAKFRSFYPDHVRLISDFFPCAALHDLLNGRKAKVITSFSMFYDLEDPVAFMRDVEASLAEDGIWVFEQSYMPTMLATNSFDTVCHEHLEFYGLTQIKWMTDRAGLEIADVEFNDVNGGSFSVTARRATGRPVPEAVADILSREAADGLDTLEPYRAFADRTAQARDRINEFVDSAKARGERVCALGASTKGNVLLQYCGLDRERIESVGEVNAEKFGCVTPGTWIPIKSQDEILKSGPDYLLVLPWHFRKFFEASPALKSQKLVFPLPELTVVD